MKKLLLAAFTSLILSACSSDDDKSNSNTNIDNTGRYKFVSVQETCEQPGSTNYCVSDQEYDKYANVNTPCTIVTVTDVDGNEHTGYYGGRGTGGSCLRTK